MSRFFCNFVEVIFGEGLCFDGQQNFPQDFAGGGGGNSAGVVVWGKLYNVAAHDV